MYRRPPGASTGLPILALLALLILPAAPATAAGPSPQGIWIDHTGRGAVHIYECETSLCGRIVWLADTRGDDGQPLTDQLNPDPARRNQPICGLEIIGGLKRDGQRVWNDGWIYDPERGESFDVEITLLSEDRLKVLGYAGIRLFGKTFRWQRASDNLELCAEAS